MPILLLPSFLNLTERISYLTLRLPEGLGVLSLFLLYFSSARKISLLRLHSKTLFPASESDRLSRLLSLLCHLIKKPIRPSSQYDRLTGCVTAWGHLSPARTKEIASRVHFVHLRSAVRLSDLSPSRSKFVPNISSMSPSKSIPHLYANSFRMNGP